MNFTRHKLWRDYSKFHSLAVTTGDVDPAYPVLRAYGAALDREQALWLTFCHVAFYNLASSTGAHQKHPTPLSLATDNNATRSPTGTERRGFRNPDNLIRHLLDLQERIESRGSLRAWIAEITFGSSPEDRWRNAEIGLSGLFGNGRWASYKTAEILSKVNGYPLHAPDMAHENSTGPRKGLALFGVSANSNSPGEIAGLNSASADLVATLADLDAPGAETETVETTLCDFHSLHRGHYYVGHDIDEQLKQSIHPVTDRTAAILRARSASFHPLLLGENNDWTGPDKQRSTAYQRTGLINIRGRE